MTDPVLTDLPGVLRNILHVLQEQPAAYRRFGVYWWPIKAMLRSRYTQDNLYLLGEYVDEGQAETLGDLGLADTLTQALALFSTNSRLADDRPWAQTGEGEPVAVWDEDAGF